MNNNLWIKGPLELLKHGKSHLLQGSSFDIRIALISIDNAVEVILKTFFEINKRKLGLSKITTKKISFKELLNLVDKYASDKVSKEDIDLIEKCHDIRNSIYHEGNGITVEKIIVETYANIVENSFKSLFNLEKQKINKVSPQEIINFTKDFLIQFSHFDIEFIEWTLDEGCEEELIADGNVESNGNWDGNWEPDIVFNFLTKKGLLKPGDYEKYKLIKETSNHFYRKKLPDVKQLQKAIKYMYYFWRIIDKS